MNRKVFDYEFLWQNQPHGRSGDCPVCPNPMTAARMLQERSPNKGVILIDTVHQATPPDDGPPPPDVEPTSPEDEIIEGILVESPPPLPPPLSGSGSPPGRSGQGRISSNQGHRKPTRTGIATMAELFGSGVATEKWSPCFMPPGQASPPQP